MPRPRRSDEQKKLSGTYEHHRSEQKLLHGRTAITEVLPPPTDLDKDARRHWQIYLPLLVARCTLSASDLPGFVALCQVSAAREKSYRAAMRSGPVSGTGVGSKKQSAAWQAYLATDAAYARWTSLYGLNPKWAASVVPLPVPQPGRLQVVED